MTDAMAATQAGIGFELLAEDGTARCGRLTTAHGTAETPAFIAVGTAATVKGLTPEMIRRTGTEIVLSNTYHLMLRPGAERIAELGGLHRFMNWSGPILTDSGGFQVMSLTELRELEEQGVTFRSHIDGSRHELTPERAIELQHLFGSDITMALDECTAFPASEEQAESSMALSMRWAERCKGAFVARPGHGLFGIVQGSVYPGLRRRSAETLTAIGFDGYAVGGLAIGEGQETTFQVLETTLPYLPSGRPRYLMGVGQPSDIVGAVKRGVDMFDCVLPTRSGRTAKGFTRRGTVNLRNARHQDDPRPLDPACQCATCQGFSRAYLHHLFRAEEMLGPILLTQHNLHYYQELMGGLRKAIAKRAFADFAAAFEAEQAQGDLPLL